MSSGLFPLCWPEKTALGGRDLAVRDRFDRDELIDECLPSFEPHRAQATRLRVVALDERTLHLGNLGEGCPIHRSVLRRHHFVRSVRAHEVGLPPFGDRTDKGAHAIGPGFEELAPADKYVCVRVEADGGDREDLEAVKPSGGVDHDPLRRGLVGLAIIVTIYRSRRSVSVDDASLLKR